PHLAREGSAGGVVEVESVEVVDVRDTGKRHGIAFLDLTEQPQSRALLQADGVSSTLATSGRDDPDLDVVELVPLAECRQRAGFVVRVSADEQDIELHGVGLLL